MVTKQWIQTWLVDFYLGTRVVTNLAGKQVELAGEKIETVEIDRAYAPTRWANIHAFALRRKHQGAEVTYSITCMG